MDEKIEFPATFEQAPLRWDTLQDDGGWSLRPAIAWLVADGRFVKGLGDLAGGIAKGLEAGGAPISRMRISTLTLHPSVRAWGGEWSTKDGANQQDYSNALQNSPSFVGSPIDILRQTGKPFRRRIEQGLNEGDHMVLHELKADGMTDYYAFLLPGLGGPKAFASFATTRPGGYTDRDIEKFQTLCVFVGPVVDAINRGRIAATLLDTYIGHRAGGRVLDGHIRRGDFERIRAAFWYSDLRDFTGLNEELPADQMVATLNSYFGTVADAIMGRGGEVLQFIGDAVLAIFECEMDDKDTRRACEAAFDAAQEALLKIEGVNAERRGAMQPQIRFGIGLHVGDVHFGNVGADTRLGFNVVGPAVNLTARLETLSKQAPVPLLMSSAFAGSIERPIWSMGSFELKGVREMQEVFTSAELMEEASL